MLDVHRLRVFRAVVAAGSVQAAAANLGYTPSAVSQQLQALARETGLTLFEKSGRGISPTPVARRLVTSSEDLMASLARLDGTVEDLREGRMSSLSISSMPSAGEAWMPAVAARIAAAFPDVTLTLDLGDERSGLPVDIEVVSEDPSEPPRPEPDRTCYELVTEPYFVIMPPGHELAASREPLPLSSLGGQALVDEDKNDTTCGRVLRNAFRASGFSPRYVARCADHHVAIAFVAAGIGVSVLPRLTLTAVPDTVVVRPLTDPTPRRRIAAYVRDGVAAQLPVIRALELLQHVAATDPADPVGTTDPVGPTDPVSTHTMSRAR